LPDLGPRRELAHLHVRVGIEPVGELVLDVDRRHVAALPDELAVFDPRRDAEMQRARGGDDQAMADHMRRRRRGEIEFVGVFAAEDRVDPLARIGVVEDVAGTDVAEDHQRAARAVVDPVGRIVFLVDDADRGVR